jgi:predicted AlkP superfamily pyrophosphatase or phosphodiesterase
VHVPTIFSEAKNAGFSTAMFVGKEKFATLDQPQTVDEFDYDKAHAGIIKKKADAGPVMMQEGTVLAKYVAADAAPYIIAKKPNLCFIHFTDTDDTGHKYGWGSPEQIKAFDDVDAALGVVMKAIQDAGIADESVVIVTADHGGHKKGHGTSLPADMNIPWVAWGRNVNKGFAITAPVNTCDTAATALWLLGIPIPASFDGKPVTSAFE